MGKTLLDLSKSLRKKVGRIDREASEVAKKVALDLVSTLVKITPVDTSRALSNWQVGIGAPVKTPIGPIVPGDFGSTKSQSASAAVAKAQLFLSSKRPGEPIFVSNALDYIGDLNNGTSKQAPSGFVEKAVMLVEKRNQGARLKL